MSDLHPRRIPFDFKTDPVPFQWNPAHPEFGLMGNSVSFLAPAFERYIVQVTKDALPRIIDPALREEAEDFIKQEAIHAGAHRQHTAALVSRYPGLQQVLDNLKGSYDDLYESESLEFHLAYVADIEATFTPLFKTILDNRDVLLGTGDDRVASLLTWHFVEEVEHRTSALAIYNAVVGKPIYRMRCLPKVFSHILTVASIFYDGVREHVPHDDLLVEVPVLDPSKPLSMVTGNSSRDRSTMKGVPKKDLLAMNWRLILSQMPRHDPNNLPIPGFAETWTTAYGLGADVTRWYEKVDGIKELTEAA